MNRFARLASGCGIAWAICWVGEEKISALPDIWPGLVIGLIFGAASVLAAHNPPTS